MQEFVLLIQGDGNYNFTEEEIALRVKRYTEWMDEQINKGQYVWGQPLKPVGLHFKDKDNIQSDGPFLEPKEMVGGIIIIKANSLDEAREIASTCPLLDEFEIFIRPVDTMSI